MSIFASNQQVFFTSLLTDQGKTRIIIFTSFATMNVNTTIVIGKNYRNLKSLFWASTVLINHVYGLL